jgi:ribosomal protein S13
VGKFKIEALTKFKIEALTKSKIETVIEAALSNQARAKLLHISQSQSRRACRHSRGFERHGPLAPQEQQRRATEMFSAPADTRCNGAFAHPGEASAAISLLERG